MADAAGLVNPKLKPVVDADVVAGVPVSNKQTKKQILFYHNCVCTIPVSIRIPKSL